MALLPDSIDYTDRDFDSIRARLIALLKSVFPDWTDFDVASFGNLLVEMRSRRRADVLPGQPGPGVAPRHGHPAEERDGPARMLGYRLSGARAATANVLFTLPRVPAADVNIPAGSIVRRRRTRCSRRNVDATRRYPTELEILPNLVETADSPTICSLGRSFLRHNWQGPER